MERLAAKIKSLAGASTADLIGLAPVDQFSEEEFGELGKQFGPIRSVIVLAQHIVDPMQTMRFYSGEVYGDSPVGASFGDALLRHTCWRVVELLREAGYRAAIPRNLHYGADGPTHSISYKKAGVLAGLGAFGRSQLLINPDWGPWMYLRTVVTEAPLPPDAPIEFSPCEGCAAPCLDACPAGALTAAGIDRDRCAVQAGYKGSGPTVMRLSPHGQINCEECTRACPVGTAPARFTKGEKPA